MNVALYECNILTEKKKIGQLKKDANGYREITLGAFDCITEKNEFYPLSNSVKNMFHSSSELMTRIKTGRLRGEIEHPLPLPGQSLTDFMLRARMIHNAYVGHHIKSLRLERGKDHRGRDVMLVIGLVKGSGPYGDQLETKMDNPDENVDFSVRSFTKPGQYLPNGMKVKEISLLITYDQVNQGGVGAANKYETPSMESIVGRTGSFIGGESTVSFDHMALMQTEAIEAERSIMGNESDIIVTSTMVRDAMGWNKVEIVTPRSSIDW